MTLTPEQSREAEAYAVKECSRVAVAMCLPLAGMCVDVCRERAQRIADDCPFIAQAKLAIFGGL